jgi:hypothetical protein
MWILDRLQGVTQRSVDMTVSSEVHVLHRTDTDGTDIFTVSKDDSDFRFTGRLLDGTYTIEFEEGFGFRGQMLHVCPDDVWRAFVQSDELAERVPESAERVTRRS